MGGGRGAGSLVRQCFISPPVTSGKPGGGIMSREKSGCRVGGGNWEYEGLKGVAGGQK